MTQCSLHAAELAASPDPAARELPFCLLCALETGNGVSLDAAGSDSADLPIVLVDLTASEPRH